MHRFRFFKNFYVASTLGLLIWLLFFEMANIPTQLKNWWKLQQLASEKAYYQAQIETLKKEEAITLSSDKLREKYAREKYFMRKPTEDVFVIVNEQNEPLEK